MHLKLNSHWILSLLLCILYASYTLAQFWRMNALSDRELFILETRSSMASGICYKEVPGKTLDPDLRMRIISHCCEGYERNTASRTLQCNPICTEDCTNGICTGPDVCECYPGYVRMGGRCEEE